MTSFGLGSGYGHDDPDGPFFVHTKLLDLPTLFP